MNKSVEIGHHTSQQYNHELEEVRNLLMQMGGLVESQLAKALKALLEQDSELGEEVAFSDYKVNQLEVEIDEHCARIIARRQPAASDLRLLLSIIKSITDLERIGDEAEKIARHAIRASDINSGRLNISLRHLGDHVREILRESLDAMARMDSAQALRVARSDSQIDQEFDLLSRQLLTHMMEDPRTIQESLNVTWCARSLERIGDHCKNICEYVIYFVEGKDIRHINLKGRATPAEIVASQKAVELEPRRLPAGPEPDPDSVQS
ncbi:MAG TPA: phosphate signaling complex protein PhoU [Thiolinea sp.]|nr:phosphate signaling complex protein PhoU [Thiolinea sp.]